MNEQCKVTGCNYCNSDAEECWITTANEERFWVTCAVCGATSPYCLSENDAITVWNNTNYGIKFNVV